MLIYGFFAGYGVAAPCRSSHLARTDCLMDSRQSCYLVENVIQFLYFFYNEIVCDVHDKEKLLQAVYYNLDDGQPTFLRHIMYMVFVLFLLV